MEMIKVDHFDFLVGVEKDVGQMASSFLQSAWRLPTNTLCNINSHLFINNRLK